MSAKRHEPPAPRPAPAVPVPGPLGSRVQADIALRPFTLPNDHTLVELRMWLLAFDAYYSSSNFDQASIKIQQQYLFACLDANLGHRIRLSIDVNTPIYGDVSVVQAIKDNFERRNPLFLRRLRYFTSKQAPGQKASDWSNELIFLGEEAELENLTVDLLCGFQMLSSVSDEKLFEKLLKTTDGSATQIEEAITDYEVKQRNLKALKSMTSAASALPTGSDSKQCMRCGKHDCNERQCSARKKTCFWCGKKGHLDTICLSRLDGIPRSRRKV